MQIYIIANFPKKLNSTNIFVNKSTIVVKTYLTLDQDVSPSDTIAVIADTSNIYIKVNIQEKEISKIKSGQVVTATLDAYPSPQRKLYLPNFRKKGNGALPDSIIHGDIMSVFCCPICGNILYFNEKEAYCDNHHHYDRAKQGYVNLLCNQSSSDKRHGDDRRMINARRRFLTKGYYAPLLNAINETILRYVKTQCVILDVGCGEAYYTGGISDYLLSKEITAEIAAIDISKEAAKAASIRTLSYPIAVASAYSLPVANNSCDIILSIFAPVAEDEFHRVLKPGGVLIRVVPMQRHLFGLKEQLYNKTYENPPVSQKLHGFKEAEFNQLKWELHLDNQEDIEALFEMTPYYYKTSHEDQTKIKAIDALNTEVAFAILVDHREDIVPIC